MPLVEFDEDQYNRIRPQSEIQKNQTSQLSKILLSMGVEEKYITPVLIVIAILFVFLSILILRIFNHTPTTKLHPLPPGQFLP
ncbi:MAG: hypothetical protein V4473_02835 [Patescibacteria group bacterium]